MKLKRYCVTVMDHWTPTREFWTRKGAMEHRNNHMGSAYVFVWVDGEWVEILRPKSAQRPEGK